MTNIIHQPKGSGTEHKEGTILVGSPYAATSGSLTSNYIINTYVTNLPTTGDINAAYSGRFDDPRYYTGDSIS